MSETADVVIIGGGVVGASVAYHLTQAGCTSVLVIERRAQLGLGSTGKAMGGVRAGLYEMTPDGHAIIGKAPGVNGFYLANGFSGHGVMHSPATGRAVAELIVDECSHTLDISTLALERFAEGRWHGESSML